MMMSSLEQEEKGKGNDEKFEKLKFVFLSILIDNFFEKT